MGNHRSQQRCAMFVAGYYTYPVSAVYAPRCRRFRRLRWGLAAIMFANDTRYTVFRLRLCILLRTSLLGGIAGLSSWRHCERACRSVASAVDMTLSGRCFSFSYTHTYVIRMSPGWGCVSPRRGPALPNVDICGD